MKLTMTVKADAGSQQVKVRMEAEDHAPAFNLDGAIQMLGAHSYLVTAVGGAGNMSRDTTTNAYATTKTYVATRGQLDSQQSPTIIQHLVQLGAKLVAYNDELMRDFQEIDCKLTFGHEDIKK